MVLQMYIMYWDLTVSEITSLEERDQCKRKYKDFYNSTGVAAMLLACSLYIPRNGMDAIYEQRKGSDA